MDIGYYNGKIGPIEEISIPLNDRVVYFGDGVYDATMSYNGVILDEQDHIDRFYSSMEKLSIPAPMQEEELRGELRKIAAMGEKGGCYMLYWSATRGTAKRRHCFPERVSSNLIITLTDQGKFAPLGRPLKLTTYEDKRYEYCNIKTLNLIPSVLAAQAAEDAGCEEAVFHRGDIVTECAHSNISMLKDGAFVTAPADHWILPGIARKNLIRCAKKAGIPVIEKHYTLDELYEADEIIVSSSSRQMGAAFELEGKRVGGKDPELLKKVISEMAGHLNAQLGERVF